MTHDRSRPDSGALREIAGLWERTSAGGREYIGGRTPDDEDIVVPAGSLVMVFPNTSDNPRAPGFRLLFAPPGDHSSRAAGADGGAFARLKASAPPPGWPTSICGTNPVAVTAPPETSDDREDVPF
ncbi:MAG: hypothetical protein F4Y02_06255 [Chloroflexi bacterium]|nr:hypothetical protein [Chloroflexota bacterium]